MRLPRGIIIAGVALAAGVMGRRAEAATLTFDDIDTSLFPNFIQISNGYGGLNWSNFYAVNVPLHVFRNGPSGYGYGVVSPDNVATNGFGLTAITSAADQFVSNSAYFTAAWNNGLSVSVDGYSNSLLVHHTTFIVVTTSPTLETFNWTLDQIVFSASSGTPAGYSSSGSNFVMDDMVISEASRAVPFPAAAWSGTLLLGALGAWSIRRQRQARVTKGV